MCVCVSVILVSILYETNLPSCFKENYFLYIYLYIKRINKGCLFSFWVGTKINIFKIITQIEVTLYT